MLTAEFVKLCFGIALLVTAVVFYTRRSNERRQSETRKDTDERFRSFQRTYLVVYFAAMMADWLQGPYVYALYESYGFSRHDNAVLFTAGFGSSAVLGTCIGSLADQFGRRKFACLYCLMYIVSCLTKHVNNFQLLLLGRVTGGIATSLLFSVFDSWMVSEHNKRSFSPDLLGATFSLAVFGNSMVAITAGEVGQVAADFKDLTPRTEQGKIFYWGYCAPFDMAILFCVLCLGLISAAWSENYGQKPASSANSSLADRVGVAIKSTQQNPQVLNCGIVCAFFEASMYIFVFMWTPALTQEGAPKPPYGHIFATFMVMSMLGSQLFSILSNSLSIEEIGRITLVVAAVCHIIPIVMSNPVPRFLSFLVFEMCVGLYFPMIGTLKGIVVPEELRSTIYNLYRVPLNVIVVLTLIAKLELQTAFTLTTILLFSAVFFQSKLVASRPSAAGRQTNFTSVKNDVEFGLDDDEPLDPDDRRRVQPDTVGNQS